MNLLFWKKEESLVQTLINAYRLNMNKLKELDEAEKEESAEHVRSLWLIQANEAYEISKRNPREGKKLTHQAEQDEVELKRFLTDLGIGRYSPEQQQIIDHAKIGLSVLLEETKKVRQEIDETNNESRNAMSKIMAEVDEIIKEGKQWWQFWK